MTEPVDALVQQLREEVGGITWRLMNLLGPSPDMLLLDQNVHSRAEMWAAQLRGDDENLAAQTVRDLVDLLLPLGEPTQQWWRTPLGQAVARSVGHPDADVVSYGVAAAMLGCSRQNITKLLDSGRLCKGTDGGVTTSSIRDELRGVHNGTRRTWRSVVSEDIR